MNTRNLIILAAVVVIAMIGIGYYLSNEETPAPETPATTTSPSPETTTPPADTPDTQPTTGEPGQQN